MPAASFIPLARPYSANSPVTPTGILKTANRHTTETVVADHIIAVGRSHAECRVHIGQQRHQASGGRPTILRGAPTKKKILSFCEDHTDSELEDVMAQGRQLQQLTDEHHCGGQLHTTVPGDGWKLSGKMGVMAGLTLLATSVAAWAGYRYQTAVNHNGLSEEGDNLPYAAAMTGLQLVKWDNDYAYPEKKQQAICHSDTLLAKCQRAHRNARKKGFYFTRLILKVGKYPCYCPPPTPEVSTKKPPADFYWGNNVGILTGFAPAGD